MATIDKAYLDVKGENRYGATLSMTSPISRDGAITREGVFHAVSNLTHLTAGAILRVTSEGKEYKAEIEQALKPRSEGLVTFENQTEVIRTDYKKAQSDPRVLVFSGVTKALQLMGLSAPRAGKREVDPDIAAAQDAVRNARAALAALKLAKGIKPRAAKKAPAK